MFCRHCDQETFAISVHVECTPREDSFSQDFSKLRDKKHTVYDNSYRVYSGMHMLELKCAICGVKFEIGDNYDCICISNKFGDIQPATWKDLWTPK